MSKKEPHPLVMLCNLREDLVLELDGVTYCWRDNTQPEKPINFPGIPHKEIEVIPPSDATPLIKYIALPTNLFRYLHETSIAVSNMHLPADMPNSTFLTELSAYLAYL